MPTSQVQCLGSRTTKSEHVHPFFRLTGPNKYFSTLKLHDHLAHVPNITQITIYQSTKLVQNLLFRDVVTPVASIPLIYGSGRKSIMQVYRGENIDALSNLAGSSRAEKLLLKAHIRETLNHADTTTDWIRYREDNDVYSNAWLYKETRPYFCGRKVAIVFTTCKRIHKFVRTANALISSLRRQGVYNTSYIEDIVVIDDQSSVSDQQKMKSLFPTFKFVFKEPHQRGHAPSLNMILYDDNIIPPHINYVLYFEDDWLVHGSQVQNSSWFLDALELLASSQLHKGTIAQVLLDNRHGGWPFVMKASDINVPYRYHEFGYFELDDNGTMVVNGEYSLWPGFSNQPSIWNLDKIRTKQLYFQEGNALFEQVFSLQYYQRGLRVVSLDRETTTHIGDDTSAYELNRVHKRYWDT